MTDEANHGELTKAASDDPAANKARSLSRRPQTANHKAPAPPTPAREIDPKSIPIGMIGVGLLWTAIGIYGLLTLPGALKAASVITFAFAAIFFWNAFTTRKWGRDKESTRPND